MNILKVSLPNCATWTKLLKKYVTKLVPKDFVKMYVTHAKNVCNSPNYIKPRESF